MTKKKKKRKVIAIIIKRKIILFFKLVFEVSRTQFTLAFVNPIAFVLTGFTVRKIYKIVYFV